mgnify:FL=1
MCAKRCPTQHLVWYIEIIIMEQTYTQINNFPETIDNSFWKCEIVQTFHNKIKDILEKTDAQYRPEEISFVLSNLENRNHYLFILEIKSVIYWCRRKKQNISIKHFKKLLELKLKEYKNLPKQNLIKVLTISRCLNFLVTLHCKQTSVTVYGFTIVHILSISNFKYERK